LLKMLRNRIQDDKGFTLIELMVVVLIIAILIAIAIPTFLGLRSRAQDRAAQSDLRNAMTAAKAFYTDDEAYTDFDAAAGEAIEPSLDWAGDITITLPATAPVAGQAIVMYRASASGTTFCIADTSAAGTSTGVGAETTVAGCSEGW
jgi:type IV pilus assembly protein PilA